ncbi:MAG: HAMP domain-containing histidine kinase [Flavobacteriales bacterium]|nr:HAMP domain-containing histidine kinase [Flavobacteriales bacterium]
MKLLRLQIVLFSVIVLVVILVSSFFQYRILSNRIHEQLKGDLVQEKISIIQSMKHIDNPEKVISSHPNISFLPFHGESFEDNYEIVSMYDSLRNRNVEYLLLKSYVTYNNESYSLIVREPYESSGILLQEGIENSIVLFVLIGLLFIASNGYLTNKLWKSFNSILSTLSNYDIKNNTSIHFPQSNVQEFRSLSKKLEVLVNNQFTLIYKQKKFLENAAHELQTPVAVLNTKLDLLVQSDNLKQGDFEILSDLIATTNQMKTMNKALLLMSKIDNDQFKDVQDFDVSETIEHSLKLLLHHADAKRIDVSFEREPLIICMNKDLAQVLFNNLLKNAIVHNKEGGKVRIQTVDREVFITNSSLQEKPLSDIIFERFNKSSVDKSSTGLGLSIVKQICDIYGLFVEYQYKTGQHCFRVKFP